MRIGFIATRLAGTDGVSLEVEKWTKVLRRMGHDVFFCAGELDGYAAGGALVPRLHFQDEHIRDINRRAFESPLEDADRLQLDIRKTADELKEPLQRFIRSEQLDLVIVQNAFAIPMNLPFGLALTEVLAETGVDAIAHNHDFFWERERFQGCLLPAFLDTYFPPDLPNICHVTINSIAQRWLQARRGIESVVVPNVHEFEIQPAPAGEYAADIRTAVGLRQGEPFILQPTRVIRRKGIELALLLVQSLELDHPALFITHSASDEGLDYYHWLSQEAEKLGVDLRKVDDLVSTRRATAGGKKVYTLWDIYPHADLITYPSLYEGFGNALLEAVYYYRSVVINGYPVYHADIRPLGFDFIELDGFVSEDAVNKTRAILSDPAGSRAAVKRNYEIAQAHFSFSVLERKLKEILANF